MVTAKSTAAPKQTSPQGRRKRKGVVAIISVLLLLLGAWYVWPNSQLDKVRKMQEELFGQRGSLSPEERKEKMEALRAEQEKLSDEERAALKKEIGKMFMKRQNAEALKYLAMSPAERQKLIDDRIAREQARRQKQVQNANGSGPSGGKGNGPMASQGGSGGAFNGPPGGGPRGPLSAEDRDEMRRQFLISASPEARAGMDQMKLDSANRRAQLGLPPSKGRGF